MPKKAKAPVFIEKLQNIEVSVGKTAIIDCVCEGDPEPDADWYFEGKIIKDAGRFRYLFEKDDVIGLEIKKITVEDEGEYKCVAFNKSGEVSCTCEVLVNDSSKKSAPKKEEEAPKPAVTSAGKNKVFVPKKKKKNKLPIERDGIKAQNPEKFYEFGEEIGRGKFSVVRECVSKKTGQKYAAKIIKFDEDSIKFAIREYDIMTSGKLDHSRLVQMHEAYLVRKYLIIIMDYCEGKTLLDNVSSKHVLTEDDVASYIKQLLEIVAYLHANNVVHLDIRPTNIRFSSPHEIKLLDYNSSRIVANKKAGEVVDVIGDTEFCAPELLNFDPVLPGSDMWSIAVIMYILLSGISPFYYEDEEQVCLSVQKCKIDLGIDELQNVTSEAKDFISKIIKRQPEMRLTAAKALQHKWLSPDYSRARKASVLKIQDEMRSTDERLYEEEEEDYIEASLVFRTFDESEYESPEESDEEED